MTTKNRSEIEASKKWNLEDIFTNLKEWENGLKQSEEMFEKIVSKKQEIFTSADSLFDYMEAQTKLSLLIGKVARYAFLLEDEDTRDSKRQELSQRLTPLSLKMSEFSSFTKSEFLKMGLTQFEEYIEQNPGLEIYRKSMNDFFRYAPHILTEQEEYIVSQTGLMGNASEIFERLTDADMKFPMIRNEKGEEVQLSEANYSKFMDSENREVRKAAYKGLMGTYAKFENTLASTFSSSLKEDFFYTKIKKHNSTLERALFADEVPLEVYDNLIATAKKNAATMHKYYALKKKALGLEELRAYDMSVPMIGGFDKEISYEQAYETMLEGLSVLGEQYIEDLKMARDSNWVDVYPTEGKRSGAYNMGVDGVHPYVLLNQEDTHDSMMTLAHEMGHAMHSYYSAKENHPEYSGYSIFVAEVASTVNEVLLMKHLMANTTDKEEKKYLLNQFIEQFKGTFFRQTMFAEFEKIVNDKTQKSEPITGEILNEIYEGLMKEYDGDIVVREEETKNGWSRIPHFYRGFYVYKYATGFAAANSLAKQILEEGQPAVERYLEFLRSGDTLPPIELLKRAGVDMSSPKPIDDAMEIFAGLIQELEELI